MVCVPDIEDIIENFAELLCDTLGITPRPTAKVFKEAALLAWDIEVGEADLFANRMAHAVIHCRIKKNQSTSGKKLSPGVFKVVEMLKQMDNDSPAKQKTKEPQKPTMGQKLLKAARRLHKKLSDESPQPSLPIGASSSGGSSAVVCCSSPMSELEELNQLYGMGKQNHSKDVMDVLSSQGSDVPPDEPLKFIEHFDSSICKLVRDFADGTRTEAKMKPGPNGVATAAFEGEEAKATECPNLLLQMPMYKKPAAALKKRPAAQPVENDSESEDCNQEAAQNDDAEEDVEENKKVVKEMAGPNIKIKKHLLYSKTYHKSKKEQEKSGKSPDEAKVSARKAANDAVAAARAAGSLED